MKISAVSPTEDMNSRRNFFIRYSNSFMSFPKTESRNVSVARPNCEEPGQCKKLGIETLEEFTIFPKSVVDGKTIITA